MTVLTNDKSNILSSLNIKDWKRAKQIMISSINSTDMRKHFKLVDKMKKLNIRFIDAELSSKLTENASHEMNYILDKSEKKD